MKYESPKDFRQALEAEIIRSAVNPGQEELLRSEVAFERALSRFDYDEWSLKGGYALRLMLPSPRYTEDLDLILRRDSVKGLGAQQRAQKIREAVHSQLSKDTGDHFKFEVRNAIPIDDMDPENLAAIVLVQVKIGDQDFCKIRIDVGVTDKEVLPREHVTGRNLLAFAEVGNPDIVTKAREEIFADKLLAYSQQTVLGEEALRFRDLVDMQLLIKSDLDEEKLFTAMSATEQREDKQYPTEIDVPPQHWVASYSTMAAKFELPPTLDHAYSNLNSFVKPLLDRYHELSLEHTDSLPDTLLEQPGGYDSFDLGDNDLDFTDR